MGWGGTKKHLSCGIWGAGCMHMHACYTVGRSAVHVTHVWCVTNKLKGSEPEWSNPPKIILLFHSLYNIVWIGHIREAFHTSLTTMECWLPKKKKIKKCCSWLNFELLYNIIMMFPLPVMMFSLKFNEHFLVYAKCHNYN